MNSPPAASASSGPKSAPGVCDPGRPSPRSSRCVTSAATEAVNSVPSPARSQPSRTVPSAHSARACAHEDRRGMSCARNGIRAIALVAMPLTPGMRKRAETAGRQKRTRALDGPSLDAAMTDSASVARQAATTRRWPRFPCRARHRRESSTGQDAQPTGSAPGARGAPSRPPNDAISTMVPARADPTTPGLEGDGGHRVDVHPCRRRSAFARPQQHALGRENAEACAGDVRLVAGSRVLSEFQGLLDRG